MTLKCRTKVKFVTVFKIPACASCSELHNADCSISGSSGAVGIKITAVFYVVLYAPSFHSSKAKVLILDVLLHYYNNGILSSLALYLYINDTAFLQC